MTKKQLLPALIILAVLVIGGGIWLIAAHAHKAQPQPQTPLVQASTTPVVPVAAPGAMVKGPGIGVTIPVQVPQPAAAAVVVTSLTPSTGPAGTLVTIHGKGFTPSGNLILFGTSSGRHYENGGPDNAYASTASSNGTTLIFQIPRTGPSGMLCDDSNHCVSLASLLFTPGSYNIAVQNQNGTSDAIPFKLTQ